MTPVHHEKRESDLRADTLSRFALRMQTADAVVQGLSPCRADAELGPQFDDRRSLMDRRRSQPMVREARPYRFAGDKIR